MLQADSPDDYVIATGRSHSVRDFVELSFKEIGINIVWEGSGLDETGKDRDSGEVFVRVDPRYFRPTEVDFLLGDSSKARNSLGWEPEFSFEQMVTSMVQEDLKEAQEDKARQINGFKTFNGYD